MIWALLLIYTVLNLLDIMTTVRGLKLGLLESNFIIRWAMERFGVAGLWAIKAVATLAVAASIYWFPSAWYIPLIVIVITAAAVVNNFRLIKEAQ